MTVTDISRRAAPLLLVLAGLLFAGCSSMGGIFGGDDDNQRDEDQSRGADRITEVRGTVDRVDTRDSIIYVETSAVYRSNLRNDEDDELALYYDSSTVIEYDGKTYEASALEAGDRILADVEDTGSRLYARDIEVTFDVTGADRADDSNRDDDEVSEVRGKVRWLDESRKILELEDASWGWGSGSSDRRGDDVVEVYWDADTVVEYDGKRYSPANLERGDEVQVELRDLGSRYVADEILVIASVRD